MSNGIIISAGTNISTVSIVGLGAIGGGGGTGSYPDIYDVNGIVGIRQPSPSNYSLDVGGSTNGGTIGCSTGFVNNAYIDLGLAGLSGNWKAQNFTTNGITASPVYTYNGTGYMNPQTGSYTLISGDNGKMVVVNFTGLSTVTVPSSLPLGFSCSFLQSGIGQVSISGSGGVNIKNRAASFTSYAQWSLMSIVQLNSGLYLLQGDTQ